MRGRMQHRPEQYATCAKALTCRLEQLFALEVLRLLSRSLSRLNCALLDNFLEFRSACRLDASTLHCFPLHFHDSIFYSADIRANNVVWFCAILAAAADLRADSLCKFLLFFGIHRWPKEESLKLRLGTRNCEKIFR